MSLPAQVADADKKADELLAGQDPQIEELTKKLAEAEQRYKVLQGKYDAEVKEIKGDVNLLNRLKSDNKQLRKQVEELTQASAATADTITELRKQLEKPTQPIEAELSEDDLESLEREGVSEKALSIIRKIIPARDTELHQKLSEISTEVKTVKQDFTEQNENTWMTTLRGQIPDIDNYIGDNADPKFSQWLDSTLRRASLQNAFNQRDINALKTGIELFKKETAEPADPKDPGKDPKDPKNALENQIEPNETVASDVTDIKVKKEYTMDEVNKFYLDQTKGKWVGREAEAAKIDKEIVLALQQGRVK